MNMSQSDQQPNVANKLSISHETKKTKSKTVAKKTNRKKRKYNEDSNTNNIEPNSKRRKVNKNNIHDKLNMLINRDKSYKKQIDELTKEKDHYKHGLNIYKQEANKWKTQYMTLYSQICNVKNTKTNLKINAINSNINKDTTMNNNELSSSPTPKHKTNHDIMQTDNIESILTESETIGTTNENQSDANNNAKLNNNINIETHPMATEAMSRTNGNKPNDNYTQLRSHTKKRRSKKHFKKQTLFDDLSKSFEENY
eukprot:401030_1